jgi:hypothetical protein
LEDILKTILISGLSSALVFCFGQMAITFKTKQDDKKKLNKLLFHLLLLKKEVKSLSDFYEEMNTAMSKLKLKLINEFGIPQDEVNEQFSSEVQQNLVENLKESLFKRDDIKLDKIKENTLILINELSETNPLFALDLNHFYNIDEKSLKLEKSFDALDFNNEVPGLSKIMMPELEKKFIDSLDNIIYETALKIDSNTYKEVIELIKFYNSNEVDDDDIDDLFNELLLPSIQKMMDNDIAKN